MPSRPLRPSVALAILSFSVLFGLTMACVRSIQGDTGLWAASGPSAAVGGGAAVSAPEAVEALALPAAARPTSSARRSSGPRLTPTPDRPHPLPTLTYEEQTHVIAAGESLGVIARDYGVPLDLIIRANNITNPDLVEVGQQLTIPVPTASVTGPTLKLIPDSELVYSPSSIDFDVDAFVREQGGYLNQYSEEVDGKVRAGAEIVQKVAQDFSVNPRLLLAVLEYRSGWVTQPAPPSDTRKYPIGIRSPQREGLYRQLAWAAIQLNRGYYTWQINGVGAWVLSDATIVPIAPTLNAGTAAVQLLFASLLDYEGWLAAVTDNGLAATYEAFFGYPFLYSVEPVVPVDLQQPELRLPFEDDTTWAFTGGPHAGWGDGSAWAAIDFAPPSDALGCVQSDEWVTAMADGLIVRAENGAVVQDLDGDGFEQTGWSILYMHLEKRGRVEVGTSVKVGDRLGHPSCEGGVSTGTHTHIARRYNGEWIAADGRIPFLLDGWTAAGTGAEYDGFLIHGAREIEAYAGRSPDNEISRP